MSRKSMVWSIIGVVLLAALIWLAASAARRSAHKTYNGAALVFKEVIYEAQAETDARTEAIR
jgi:hypothetical protein